MGRRVGFLRGHDHLGRRTLKSSTLTACQTSTQSSMSCELRSSWRTCTGCTSSKGEHWSSISTSPHHARNTDSIRKGDDGRVAGHDDVARLTTREHLHATSMATDILAQGETADRSHGVPEEGNHRDVGQIVANGSCEHLGLDLEPGDVVVGEVPVRPVADAEAMDVVLVEAEGKKSICCHEAHP